MQQSGNRLAGHINYVDTATGTQWGQEDWSIMVDADGLRTLSAHCELNFAGQQIVRDSVQSVARDWHPVEAYVRIVVDGHLEGSGWFAFNEYEAICESRTRSSGRISQRLEISRPIRGFGTHVLQADAWMTATFPFDQGPGHRQFYGRNLLHSTHHLGATGPMLTTTGSGLEYVGDERIEVPAGSFECRHMQFIGFTNDHPPYDFWVSADERLLFIKGVVGGYMASHFELSDLSSMLNV